MGSFKQRLMENREQGQALVIAIILLTAMEVLGFALTTLSEIDYSVTGNLMRSEEGLYAAEQGIMRGIDDILNNQTYWRSAGLGTVRTISSADTNIHGRVHYTGGPGSDPLPNWTVTITNIGITFYPIPLPRGYKNYRFHIVSTGTGATGLTRQEIVEIGIRSMGVFDSRSGEGGPVSTRKLAATKSFD
jgi:hypothetical protein